MSAVVSVCIRDLQWGCFARTSSHHPTVWCKRLHVHQSITDASCLVPFYTGSIFDGRRRIQCARKQQNVFCGGKSPFLCSSNFDWIFWSLFSMKLLNCNRIQSWEPSESDFLKSNFVFLQYVRKGKPKALHNTSFVCISCFFLSVFVLLYEYFRRQSQFINQICEISRQQTCFSPFFGSLFSA